MRIDITGPISRTISIPAEKDEEGAKVVVPGAITGNRAEFMRFVPDTVSTLYLNIIFQWTWNVLRR